MMRRDHRVAGRGLVAAALVALLPLAAAAHETRDVGAGKYAMEIGFLNEPAYLGQQNGLFMRVGEYASGGTQPVEGLAATLEAEVTKDGATLPLPLVPQQEEGVYQALFFPTATGDYTFRVFGEIEGEPVDESFASSPTTFNPVEPIDAVQFPARLPTTADLGERLDDAEDEAAGARTLAIAGLAVGALGLAAGGAGVALARRRPAAIGSRVDVAER